MKLAFSTLPCSLWSLEKTLRICKESNMDAIEMRMGLNEWSNIDMSHGQIQNLLNELDRYKLSISNLGTPVVVKDYSMDQLELIKKYISFAKAVDVKGLRIMLGSFRDRWSEVTPEPDYNGIVRWLEEAAAAARKDNTEIWIETHNEFASGKSLRKLLDDVQMPNCRIIWDILHPLEADESISETIKNIGSDIAHVHIKDGKPWEDKDKASWKYTKIGEGMIPIVEIIHRLEDAGFEGYYSLEWESLWRPEIRGDGCEGEIVIPNYAEYMMNIGGRV